MTQPQIKTDIESRVQDTGDVMTGNLMITNQVYPRVSFKPNTSGYSWIEGNEKGTSVISQLAYGDIGYRALRVANTNTDISSSIQIVEKTDDAIFTTYTLLHTGNKNLITYADVGAVKYEKIVGTNIDFDPLLTTGIYSIYGSNNGPVTGSHGTLYVDADVGTKYQVWTLDNQTRVWKRWWDNTNQVWKAWTDVWNISVTKDGNGNVITSTYLPLTGGTLTGKLILKGTNDSAAATSNSGLLLIGDPNGVHLSIDANEIMCKNTATTAGELILNNDGGSIYVGSKLTVNGELTTKNNFYCNSTMAIRRTGIVKGGTLPSSTMWWTFNNCDANGNAYGNALGQFETCLTSEGLTRTYIRARQFVANTASTINTATLYVQVDINGNMKAGIEGASFYGAVWNDYAEYRDQEEKVVPGYCVRSQRNGKLLLTTERLSPCDGVVSDTFGFAIGETEDNRTPIAVSGRVLVYVNGDRESYEIGDCLCAGPGGLAYKMSREEIKEYPDRIIGTVSEIPQYKIWGTGEVEVNNRIWINVK